MFTKLVLKTSSSEISYNLLQVDEINIIFWLFDHFIYEFQSLILNSFYFHKEYKLGISPHFRTSKMIAEGILEEKIMMFLWITIMHDDMCSEVRRCTWTRTFVCVMTCVCGSLSYVCFPLNTSTTFIKNFFNLGNYESEYLFISSYYINHYFSTMIHMFN